jgi:hypothetical protein
MAGSALGKHRLFFGNTVFVVGRCFRKAGKGERVNAFGC